jgi:hypothetical protein
MLNTRQFKAIYDDFLESGLTIRGYCDNQHITEYKFYYWQNKLKKELAPKRGFVPVVFENEQQARSPQVPTPGKNRSKTFSNPADLNKTVSCEISYPNGVCLKLNGLTDPEMLRSLLHLVHQ